MNVLKIATLAFVAITGGISAVKAQSASEIMDKHISAVGGADKWNSVKSMKLVGGMSMGGMDIGITQTLVTDKGMRTDINAMGMEGYVIITPKEGWMYMPFQPGMDKVTPLPQDQVKASQDKLNMKNGYLVDKSKIKSVEYLGKDTLKMVPCYMLKVTDNDGNVQTAYIDMATYYLVRSDMKVKVQDEDHEITASYSNFQKLPEGIVVPMFLSTDQGDMTFKSIEVNKPIDENIFKPSAMKSETEPGAKGK